MQLNGKGFCNLLLAISLSLLGMYKHVSISLGLSAVDSWLGSIGILRGYAFFHAIFYIGKGVVTCRNNI